MLINTTKNLTLFLVFSLMVILLLKFFKYTEKYDASNAYSEDVFAEELSLSKTSFIIPSGFQKFEPLFQLPPQSQYVLLNYIRENFGQKYEFYSDPYEIYYQQFSPNQYNFIFVIDIQNKDNYKIESIRISMISENINLNTITIISSNIIEYPKLLTKAYQKDMNTYKIGNALGIM